ncbi:metal ABC transporter solute-binding protein, Zn/Mn family [Pseudonocardia sp. GCM10023141]|uniref:metal ABC transporter solute-binding protein, Zn/Mn family n=1 Tax=Pseudonocardia sp. GCM10023141 TaxID=3252653 RepID=UPI0036135326
MPLRRLTPGRLGIGAAVAATVTLALTACGSPAATAPPTAGGSTPIAVVTSTNVYGSIVKAIGGDKITVDSLINDPAADPHSYESTPADAVKISKAAIVVLNGGGYDDWMPKLVQSAGDAAGRTVIDVAALSGLEPSPAPTDGSFNEHVWYDLPTVTKLASTLSDDLAKADAANAATYSANAQAFIAKLAELTTKTKAIGTAHPGARVAITEPVPGYLIKAAGLTDATPTEFAEAVEEDIDPPAAVLQATLALFAGTDRVKALILNAQTETPTTNQVKQAAQTSGVPVVDVTETLPAGATDYVTWMGGEIDALATALNRA